MGPAFLGGAMIRRALYFLAPGRVEVREEKISEPEPGQVGVETLISGISAGSELLIYRGQAPEHMAGDPYIPALSGSNLTFPLKYGYSSVGRVYNVGPQVDGSWLGRLVFSFQPHQSHFVAYTHELFPLPEGVSDEEAVFLPNVETAVNLVMDGRPMIGEAVVVLGQGIVGLLSTALLSRFPLDCLLTLDGYPRRREISVELGAAESFDPAGPDTLARLTDALETKGGADLVYELSGNPAALDMALGACGFGARIVLGSWYGKQRAAVDLGGTFHRNRVRVISSQVSTVAPELTGRWSKPRRLEVAWRWLQEIGPTRFITRRFPLERADEAYNLLHQDPSQDLQVILTYDS